MEWRLRQPARAAALIALLALAAASAIPAAAEPLRIGGTGAALGTMRELGEAFRKTHPQVQIDVLPSLGSTGGVRAVLAGAVELGVASRALKPEELGAGAVQAPIGLTPFVFAVPAASKIDSLRSADLIAIYAGTMTHWPDGSPIRLVLRTPSGAEIGLLYDISPQMKEAHMAAEKRPGLLTTATDQENAEALETIPGAIGVIGLAQLIVEKRALHALRIDGVAPTPAALRAGSYRPYVPLYFVTGPRLTPLARQFMAFTRTAAGAAILSRHGYLVPPPEKAR